MNNAELKDHRTLIDVSKMTRDDVVPYYASLIVSGSEVHTKRINALILQKWTPSGLLYIKEKAWKTEVNGMTLYDAWKNDLLGEVGHYQKAKVR